MEEEAIEFNDEATEASDDYNTQEGESVKATTDAINNDDSAQADELNERAKAEQEATDSKRTAAADQSLKPFNKLNGTNLTSGELIDEIKNNPDSPTVTKFCDYLKQLWTQLKDFTESSYESLTSLATPLRVKIFMILGLLGGVIDNFLLNKLITKKCVPNVSDDDPKICGTCYQLNLKSTTGDSVKETGCTQVNNCNCQKITSCCSGASCVGCGLNDSEYDYYWNNFDLETIMAIFPTIAKNTWQAPSIQEDKNFKTKVLQFLVIIIFLIGLGYFTFKLFKKDQTIKLKKNNFYFNW